MSNFIRPGGRADDELRATTITRNFTNQTPGSVLISTGDTKVLCTSRIQHEVPDFLKNKKQGWVHAEYNMLPGSTNTRKARTRDARGLEIERLIARALRGSVDMKKMADFTIMVDCDVLQADGGTRTASVTGGFIAMFEAAARMVKEGLVKENPVSYFLAATSVGIVDGRILLDLCYEEDFLAATDLNLVMTDSGGIVEIQGTAEEGVFSPDQLAGMVEVGSKGVRELLDLQKKTLGLG